MKRASSVLAAIAVLLAILLLAVPAQGGGCRVVAVHQQHHVKQAVVVEKQVVAAVVTPIVAQFVPVPLYGATYSPYAFPPPVQSPLPSHPQAAPCADLAGTVQELKAQIGALKAQLAGKPMQPADDPFNQPQAQQQAADPVSRILAARCAACHDESKAKAAGKGIVLTLAGKAKQFTPEELGGIIAVVSNRTMPKGVPMPDGERIELIAALTGGSK